MNKKTFLVMCIFLFIFSVAFTVETYSYFSTQVTGYGSFRLATWNFEVNDEALSFTTDLGELYPGIDRSYQVKLSAVGSEVPVDYTLTFNYPHNIPENLKFYRDAGKQLEINLNGDTVIGRLDANTETVITIYYDWPYGSSAEEYIPGDAWFNMTVSGHQTDPSRGV